MKIYPAIDLRSGKVVRLTKGDYDRMTVYSDDPSSIAKSFYEQGSTNLHVVDLDGAKDNGTPNYEVIKNIVSTVPEMFVEVGGGIRTEERIVGYLEAGVSRVILGSVAVEDPEFVRRMCVKYGESIAVGVDASDGYVAIHGWKTVSDKKSVEFCREMKELGVSTVIYTDISKDGTLGGTNLEIYKELSALDLNIIASGGITFEYEIESLAKMNLYGAILGKALYAGRLDLKRAIAIAEGR